MNDIVVKLYPAGKTVQVKPGTALRRLAEGVPFGLRMPCGGKGRCGKCKIIFIEGAPSPTPAELDALSESEIDQGYRLGCMSVLHEDAVIHIPDGGRMAKIITSSVAQSAPLNPGITKKHFSIQAPTIADVRSDLRRVFDSLGMAGNHADFDLSVLRQIGRDMRDSKFALTAVCANGVPIAFERGDTTGECYGVALDVGTTTLAAYLLDLNAGKQLSVAAAVNPQTRVGDDVISRISYSTQDSANIERLRACVTEEFNNLLKTLALAAEVSQDRIYEVALVGNTCMTHLFLGIDPWNLAQAPYVPTVSQSVEVKAGDLGIDMNPCGRVYVLPNIAGYVGADTVGVILATGLYKDEQMTLAVDIGTNGEIVLGSKKRMVCCSTAAGPAFEGAHIKHGVRASAGAIDAAWLEEDGVRFNTIGGGKAVGICGSGLLDVIMCLVKAGAVDASGRIVDPDELPEESSFLRGRLRAGTQGNEFIIGTESETETGEPLVVTQRDIREVQLAKGAIAAGIRTLMDRLGIRAEDIDRVMLAGAFGNCIRKESAIASGMLPAVPVAKIRSIGNAAGEGAKLSLISLDARQDADRVATEVEYIELTADLGFQERFADSLMFSSGS